MLNHHSGIVFVVLCAFDYSVLIAEQIAGVGGNVDVWHQAYNLVGCDYTTSY